MPKPYVLLDRDGTINVDVNYLSKPEDLALIPGAAAGLRKLKDHGFGLVVVTNQSGIARGYFSESDLSDIHARLVQILAEEGVFLDGIYVCPHGPEDGCDCRKPSLGMVQKAVGHLGFDPALAFMVGDKAADIKLGQAMGGRAVLVRTGYGADVASEYESGKRTPPPDAIVDDLAAAAGWILTKTTAQDA